LKTESQNSYINANRWREDATEKRVLILTRGKGQELNP